MRLSLKSYFVFSSILAQGVRIVSSFALFRLLTPMDYGAVALVGLAPGYLAALGDFGALRAVYVLDGRVPKARGTCLSIALLASGVLALVSLVAGIYLGWVKNEPVFYLLGLLAALNAPLNSAYEFGLMLLNLERNFAFEANTRLVRALMSSGSCLGMAWAGFGPVAISGSLFAGTVLSFVLVLLWHPRLLGLASSRETARKALGLGMRMTGAQYLNNLNPTVVATFATFTGGQLGLGLFGRSTQLIDMFNQSFLNNLPARPALFREGIRRALGTLLPDLPRLPLPHHPRLRGPVSPRTGSYLFVHGIRVGRSRRAGKAFGCCNDHQQHRQHINFGSPMRRAHARLGRRIRPQPLGSCFWLLVFGLPHHTGPHGVGRHRPVGGRSISHHGSCLGSKALIAWAAYALSEHGIVGGTCRWSFADGSAAAGLQPFGCLLQGFCNSRRLRCDHLWRYGDVPS